MKHTNDIYAYLITLPLLFGAVATQAQAPQPFPRDSLVQPPEFPRTLDQKIDRIGEDVTDIKRDVRTLHSDLVESPISSREWGVEFSPLGLLWAGRSLSLAGTVSNFSWNRSAEIAFPIYFHTETGDEGTRILSIDAQYRRFLGSAQRGFYLSGFARYQNARYGTFDYLAERNTIKTLNRMGIGFGIGSRIFSHSRFYWGWNISLGRFIVGNQIGEYDYPDNLSLLRDGLIVDLELLKIGFAL